MNQALQQTLVFGVLTNIAFLNFLLSHKDFINNEIQINSLERIHKQDWKKESIPFPQDFLKELFKELKNVHEGKVKKESLSFNPWSNFFKNK